MTGPFNSTPVIPASGQAPQGGTIVCGPFWPDIDLDHLRKSLRVDQTVTIERLRDVARNAVLDIMAELNDWRHDQTRAGHTTLADVPARQQVDNTSDYVIRWTRAVHSVIAADLADRQLGQSARSAGMERVEELSADIDVHRRNVTYAVRDFLGRPRIIAEVI
ncbi:head completion/stabilization protein [Brevundimonas sp. BH3]|uniref:head completion/stabilization protein n=1 Tax=Brevundimonas sp. BH3 TaxID=3133089 RepID=UPI0032507DF6